MARQVNGHGVDAGVRCANRVHGMKNDAELFRVNSDQQISIILVVVILQYQCARLYHRIGIEIADFRAFGWLLCGLSVLSLHQRIRVVAAIPAYHKWHIETFSGEIDRAGVALVIMSVPGKERMRVNALCFADGVDVAQHRRVSAVIAASAFAAGRRLIAESRMVSCQQHCTLIIFRFDAFQLSG